MVKESDPYVDTNFIVDSDSLSSILPIYCTYCQILVPSLALYHSIWHIVQLWFLNLTTPLRITKLSKNQTLMMMLIPSLVLIMITSRQVYFILWKCTWSGPSFYKMRK